jgi:hypothetical protein
MALDRLAPDQRAVVQLVLAQGRSYDDLSELLAIPVQAVRARAHDGLRSLAPDTPEPADPGAVCDFLLGQQAGAEQRATRRLLASDPAANAWAEAVALQLHDVAPDLPEIPALREDAAAEGGDGAADVAAARAATSADTAERPRPRPRPLRGGDTPRSDDRPRAGDEDDVDMSRPAASRLGGALLIAGLAIAVAAILIFVVGGGDDDDTAAGNGDTPAAEETPAAAATPQPVGQIPLRRVRGQTGRGVMALFGQPGAGLVFTLAAERVPALEEGEAYAMWLTGGEDAPRLLGFFQEAPQGENRQLATSGPQEQDADAFAGWLTTYEQIVVTKETDNEPGEPGEAVLRGALPSAQQQGG